MKIQKIETFPLLCRLPKPYGDANGIKEYRTCYLIRITTETGVDGWGECVDWLPTLHKGFQERIIPNLIGKSIFDRTKIVRTIKKWHSRAATAISMALTEIMAKTCGVSVCDLWGGKLHDSIPVYASFQSYSEHKDWQKHSLEAIEQTVNQGFDKMKVKIGGKSIAGAGSVARKNSNRLGCQPKLRLERGPSVAFAPSRLDQFAMAGGAAAERTYRRIRLIKKPVRCTIGRR